MEGGKRQLEGHTHNVRAVVECAGQVCRGSKDESIRVWSMVGPDAADSPAERSLAPGGGGRDADFFKPAWEGRLIGGHGSGKLRVWSVASEACEQVLAGHQNSVSALAVCGSRLLSGSA